jgi:hypothetical protein
MLSSRGHILDRGIAPAIPIPIQYMRALNYSLSLVIHK